MFVERWPESCLICLWIKALFFRFKTSFRILLLIKHGQRFGFVCQTEMSATSGVFKGRRARHLPRPPLFGAPPLRCYARKFFLVLMKNVLFTHIMYCKADHNQVLCFQRAPLQKLYCAGTLLWKGPPTATAIWRYSTFKRAPNSHWNVEVLCIWTSLKRPLKETVILCFERPPNSHYNM